MAISQSAIKKNNSHDFFIDSEFAQDVLQGLLAENKFLSPKYFYDEVGSGFFDQICELDEYYPYKTELGLLPEVAEDLGKVLKDNYSIIEFGAGSLLKVRPLLENVKGVKQFVPIDISGEHLRNACKQLEREFPKIEVRPVEADFCSPVDLGAINEKSLGFFPGSTIGNFKPDEAKSFLQNAKTTLGPESVMLVGVDTKKSPATLHNAYNDSEGVTANFNLNILARINAELKTDFVLDQFEHYACFDAIEGCIKMFLVSLIDQQVNILGNEVFFTKGECIHTESSYKYTPSEFSRLARMSGWRVERCWMAEDEMFSTFLLAA